MLEKESGKIVLSGFPVGTTNNVVTYEIIQETLVIKPCSHPFLHLMESQVAQTLGAPLARSPNFIEKIGITIKNFPLLSKLY